VRLADERTSNTGLGRPVAAARTIALTMGAGTSRAIALATIQHSAAACASLRSATHPAVVSRVPGRLHGPDDAQVEPREVDVGRAQLLLYI
jgi:hypothetical protein